MRWFKKEIEKKVSTFQGDFIVPVELNVRLDAAVCQEKIDKLLAYRGYSHIDLDILIELLHEKHLVYAQLLDRDNIENIQRPHIESLANGNQVLISYLNTIPLSVLQTQLKMLLHGDDELLHRMNLFVECFGDVAKPKLESAIWNFMAELLHFFKPELYPLMSRWVWHEATQKGAMREFVQMDKRHSQSLGGQSVDFEACRVWLAQQLGKKGLFRDVHYFIDLICAQAYADNILSISSGSKFTEYAHMNELDDSLAIILKLLGIEVNQTQLFEMPRNVILH